MHLGIQLWQVLNENSADGALFERLARMGYTFVEPCILFGEPVPELPAFWTPEKYFTMVDTLANAGLSVRSCHLFSLRGSIDPIAVTAFAERSSIRDFVVKCPGQVSKTLYEQTALEYEQLAASLSKIGGRLLLHPEATDCIETIEGVSAFEWMLQHVDALKVQADVGWLYYGFTGLSDFFDRYRDSIVSVHYKDIRGTQADGIPADGASCAIGAGVVPMFEAFCFAREMEIPQIVDSDSVGAPILEEAEQAAGRFLAMGQQRLPEESVLEMLDTETGERKVLHVFDRVIEAPNWLQHSPDVLLYNSEGHLYRYFISEEREELIDSGECDSLNNDHVPAPDERWIGVSHMTVKDGQFTSKIFAVDLDGQDAPKQLLPGSINFLHGWSPDGKELACCTFHPADPAFMTSTGRKADGSDAALDVDVWTTNLETGEEKRLTFGRGYSDGPEYDPDNETIWFNSTMGGRMQIYTIRRDGTSLTYIPTTADRNDWFPHVSPDGRKVVFLSFGGKEILPSEHIPGMHVRLYLMNRDGTDLHEIARLYGGQGTINVNSWAPDSRHIAFVSYRKK